METREGKEKGGGGVADPKMKYRRPKGVTADSLSDFILVLHTFVRDWSEVATDAEEHMQAGMLQELASLLKEEYDKRHG